MIDEYGGKWVTVFSGGKLHFLNPRPEEIRIGDIAHALSLTCRFGGQCRSFYSVAEHSIRMVDIVPQEYKLLALLHDASEAYLPDLPRPMKATLPDFITMERFILVAIWDKFGVKWFDNLDKIKEADNILLATEARDLMPNTEDWAPLPEPLNERIIPASSIHIEQLFLNRYRGLKEE